MDMMLNPGSRDKNINLFSHDWRSLIGSYDNRQEDGMPSLIHKVSVLCIDYIIVHEQGDFLF